MVFIFIVFSITFYAYCIWSIYKPEQSFLFLQRWKYKETPEISDIQIILIKVGSVIAMILWTVLIIEIAIDF